MLQIFYCSFVWLMVALFIAWRLIKITRQAVSHLQRLHQIPCANCAFFTGDYRLKCTVHPITAMSEEAIDCHDFTPNTQQQVFSCRYQKSSKFDRPLAKI
jgi:aminoglycoside phosphotransferase